MSTYHCRGCLKPGGAYVEAEAYDTTCTECKALAPHPERMLAAMVAMLDLTPVDPTGEFRSYPEAARILGCDERTVGRLVAAGDLESPESPGRHKRVTDASIRDYLRRGRAPKFKTSKRPVSSIKAEDVLKLRVK